MAKVKILKTSFDRWVEKQKGKKTTWLTRRQPPPPSFRVQLVRPVEYLDASHRWDAATPASSFASKTRPNHPDWSSRLVRCLRWHGKLKIKFELRNFTRDTPRIPFASHIWDANGNNSRLGCRTCWNHPDWSSTLVRCWRLDKKLDGHFSFRNETCKMRRVSFASHVEDAGCNNSRLDFRTRHNHPDWSSRLERFFFEIGQ